MHDGLEVSENYDFDRPFPSQTCSHEEMVGNQVIASCMYESDQARCPLFEPEDYTVVRQVVVEHPGFNEQLRLVRTRVQYGFVEYRIVSENISEDESEETSTDILHRINAHQHGDEAKDVADELFDHEISTRGPLETFDLDLPPQTPPPSYLKVAAS